MSQEDADRYEADVSPFRPQERPTLVHRTFPVSTDLADYPKRNGRRDLVAGVTVDDLDLWANVSLHPRADVTPDVVVHRLDDQLMCANARYVKGRVLETVAGAPSSTHRVVFDAEGLGGVDASGAQAIEQLVDGLGRDGIDFVVARLKAPMRQWFDDNRLGADHFFPTVARAVEWCSTPSPED